jgi:MerR HTH family regulatory protein
MERQYLLGEVAKLLNRKPHQIVHLLASGKIPEPEQRIGNRRLFSAKDVERLGRHFKVSPKWSALDETVDGCERTPAQTLVLKPPFLVRQASETGHEVMDDAGEVFAWSGDRAKALILAGLLESAARG